MNVCTEDMSEHSSDVSSGFRVEGFRVQSSGLRMQEAKVANSHWTLRCCMEEPCGVVVEG